jgi:hypothetical protein
MELPPNGLEPSPGTAYPPPPSIHWTALLFAFLLIEFLLEKFLPDLFIGFADTLLLNAWLVYLCLWMRKLDPRSRSLPWAFVSIAAELALNSVQFLQNEEVLTPTPALGWLIRGLMVASFVLAVAVVFIMRSELEQHYNQREPIGLYLSPALTFLFSCLYFQYHFYDIAQFKKRQAKGLVSGTLL